MKRETRILEYMVKNGVLVGLVKRGESIEHVIVEKIDGGLGQRLSRKTELQEVRRTLFLEQQPSDASSSMAYRMIGGEKIGESSTKSFQESLAQEIIRLMEVLGGK